MADASLTLLTVAQLAKHLRGRDVSPVEVAQAFIERIDALEPRLNAFITKMPDQALAAARQAEQEIGQGNYRGPLHGIPVGFKDLFWTAGVRTTSGSRVTADFVPDEDAAAVALLRDAGAYAMGKTNMVEYAYGSAEHNDAYGPPRNPWGLDHVTGGSSSGSGAAVAAGMLPIALGSDTAGSVRAPASLCGLSGLKPTYGLVSRYGVTPLSWSQDHVGPMAHTAEDVAIAMNVLAGHDSRDPGSARHPKEDYTAGLDRGVAGLRIGVVNDDSIWGTVQPEVRSAFGAAMAELASLGATAEEVTVGGLEQLSAAQFSITSSEASTYHRNLILEHGELYHPVVRRRIEAGFFQSANAYVQARRVRGRFAARFASLFETFDLLALPTTPFPAPLLEGEVRLPSGDMASREIVRLTRPFSPNGLPAISVPCGFSAEGLPLGLQLVGKPFADARVIASAHAYQQVTDWHTRRPDF